MTTAVLASIGTYPKFIEYSDEDAFDNLMADEIMKRGEPFVAWEEIKARLDAKHGIHS